MRLIGVEADQAGMIPRRLEEACKRHKPKAVYLVPTIHNPTTAHDAAGAARAAR